MKALKICRAVLLWLLVAVAVGMMIFTIVAVTTFDQKDRSLFGYKAFIILSDSMKATDFAAGDLVLVKEVDPTTLTEGDIISYISQDSASFGQTITHKIRRLDTDTQGQPGFVTYGTTTGTDDATLVTYPYIIGKYCFSIPKLGTFFTFLKTTPGYLLCIFLPFMLLILSETVRCVRLLRRYRQEQQAQLQAQRDEIEAQRLQAQLLMDQALAMQARMADQAEEQKDPV